MSDLATIGAGWDQAAREDPIFNILTDAPGRTPEQFFAHGQGEIDVAMERLRSLGLECKGDALDFGCGLGRLTQALAVHYDHVVGVDVSAEMVRQARTHNRHGKRVAYRLNRKPDLALFENDRFDLVYSMIVLQHMPVALQRGYVSEFFRVLAPGGVAMFEVPDGPDYMHAIPWLSMYGVSRSTVEKWIAEDDGKLVDVELIPEPSAWACYRYTAVAS